MRRYLRVPQLAAVMGPCIAGGAYLPALSDVIVMVKGTSFMGLGGPNLVKGATGQTIDGETLGGAVDAHRDQRRRALRGRTTTPRALAKLRELVAQLPPERRASPGREPARARRRRRTRCTTLLPADHRMSYDMHTLLARDHRRRRARRVPGAISRAR